MSNEEMPKGPLTREEYERRHQELQDRYDDRYDNFARRTTRILVAILAAGLLSAVISAYLLHENSERTEEINGSLVENCVNTGNPTRATLRKFGGTLIEQTQAEINESITLEKSGTYGEIFPNYPSDKLHKLLTRNRQKDRKTKRELREAKDDVKIVDCEARYPDQ